MVEEEEPEIIITATEPSSSYGTTAATVTRKRSLVWAYFRESPTQKEAICNLCEQNVSTCGSTTNIVKMSHYCCLTIFEYSILGWSLHI